MSREQIDEMAKVLINYTKKNHIMASHVILKDYAEALYNAGYRKQSEGEWKHPPYAPFGGSYEMKRCSVCGYKPDTDSENPYTKFCPHCGAHMRKEGEGE